jgi:hypothetical protein
LHPTAAEAEDELDAPGLPLLALDFVKIYSPTVDKSRDTVIQEMENMIFTGLADLVSYPHSRFALGQADRVESSTLVIITANRS